MTHPRYETEPVRDVPDNVVELCGESAVERAWNAYADKAGQIVIDPHLLVDREFNQDMARLYERWRKLFLMRDSG